MGESARVTAGAGLVLAALLPWAPVRADTFTQFRLDLVSINGGTTTISQECTGNVCALPAGEAPLPIPFPVATVDATDGVLRGRMRVEADLGYGDIEAGEVTLRGSVSFSTMATASFITGAPIVLSELGMMGITASPRISNSAQIKAGACAPYTECRNQTASTSVTFGVLDSAGNTVAESTSGGSVSAGAEGGPWDDARSIVETASVEAPAAERFGLFWRFTTLLHLDRGRHSSLHYAENDFSHTLGFTGLNFYDGDGNDVTRWIDVTYDSPLVFLTAPVPEPGTYAMLLAGLGLLGLAARRRARPAD